MRKTIKRKEGLLKRFMKGLIYRVFCPKLLMNKFYAIIMIIISFSTIWMQTKMLGANYMGLHIIVIIIGIAMFFSKEDLFDMFD